MSDDTKILLQYIALAVLMAILTAGLVAVFVWTVTALFNPDFSWLEQHGLRGLWCGTGGCE